jgi:hypothetical protein
VVNIFWPLEKGRKEETKWKNNNMPLGHSYYATHAIEKPGRMLEAHTAFHNYSFGNGLLALEECTRRSLQPGPLNTYPGGSNESGRSATGKEGVPYACPYRLNSALDEN